MKIASKNRLSLRKLFTAMLAVGPLAVLPSPLWAVLPTASSFTVTNGSATLSPSGNTVNINFSDKAILSWGVTANATGHIGPGSVAQGVIADGSTMTNFIVDFGDTWNFASAGSILNKVIAGSNTTNAGLGGATAAAALINGQLLGSNAKVFVLANGGIVVGNGAQLNTQNLILSTLTEASDGTFITLGDLLYNGASTGSISIGTIASGGSLRATASAVSMGGGTVAGDLVLRSVTSGSAINLAAAAATTVGGNLSVTTLDGIISQTNALTVGALTTGMQDVTVSSGAAATSLNNAGNDFERVIATTSGAGGSVTVRDANIVTLGASSIGGDLDVKVGGKTNTTAISTDGAVVVGGNLWLDSTVSSNSNISIGNNSSVAGFVTAQTSGGSVSLTTVGNLTIGNITANATATQFVAGKDTNGAAWAALQPTSQITAGAVTGILPGGFGYVYTAAPTVILSAPPAVAGAVQATATATLTGGVITGYTVTAAGAGYTAAPTVTLDGGTPVSAGLASLAFTPAWIAAGGASPIYTGNQTLTIAAPTAAATVAPVNGALPLGFTASAVTNGGSNYLVTPAVTIVGGNGAGATATATLTGDKVTGITILTAGAGYTTTPTFVIDPPVVGAVAAEGVAVRNSTTGLVTSFTITNAGLGYGTSIPQVGFRPVNTGNNFSAQGRITANTTGALTNVASGFATNNIAPVVPVSGLLTSDGVVLRGASISIGAPINVSGNFASSFNATAGGVSFGSAVTANRITVTAAGGNITQTVAGIITTNNGTTGSTFNAGTGTISLDVAPNFFSAGAPFAVTASAASIKQVGGASGGNLVIGTTNVTGNYSVRTENAPLGGLGYTTAPTVTISPPPLVAGNAQATATATVVGGVLTGITVTSAGAGYTAAPTVTLVMPTGHSNTISANVAVTLVQTGGTATTPFYNVAAITPVASGTNNHNITLGFGDAGLATAATVGGVFSVSANNGGWIRDNNDSRLDVFTGLNLSTGGVGGGTGVGGGDITLDAATFPGALTPSVRYGIVNATTSAGGVAGSTVTLAENTTLNLGNITASGLTASSATGGVIDSGTITLTGTANFTLTGTNNVVLDNNNVIPTINLTGGVGNSITNLVANTKLESTTNSTGTTTIGTYGANSGYAVSIGNVVTAGNVVVNSGAYIDVVGQTNITGNLMLTATGNVPTAAALGNVYLANATVNAGTGRLTVLGSSNLPTLTYATAPTVTITGGGLAPVTTAGKAGTVSLGVAGEVTAIANGTVGAGYWPAPVVVLGAPPVGGTQATATVAINSTTGALNGYTITNAGLGYTAAPAVTLLSAQNQTPVAATPVLSAVAPFGTVASITVTTGGSNLVLPPTVVLDAPPAGGVRATATAIINAAGTVTGYTITNAGSGYTAAPKAALSAMMGAVTTPATAVANLGPTGQIIGFNVTNNTTNGGPLPYIPNAPIDIAIAGPTTTSISQSTGTLKVGGTTSIASVGNAVLFRGNDFANVVLDNSTGGALINDVTGITVSGVSAGSVEIRSGANGNGTIGVPVAANVTYPAPAIEANPWGLVLGNLNVASLVAEASNGGAGNSGTITQASGTTVHSYGLSRFAASNNAITVGNNGNNFGRVELLNRNTDSSVTYTIVEDGTMKIGNITNRGTTNVTSRFGGIIEDPAADVVISNNGTLSATAATGSILIGNTTHTAGTTTANVVTFNASAPTGQVAMTSNNSTRLGNINANSLTVLVDGGNGLITQTGVIQTFGSANFTAGRVAVPASNVAANGGSITLDNVANNFGRIFMTSQGATDASILITEGGTLNLGRVTMPALATGTFTATSVNGDVIDTGLGGVKPGGTVAAPGTGIITLSALNGNVLLDDPTTDFPTTGGVVFSAANVTLSPLGSSALYLGAVGATATVTGNLTVTSATGSIFNAGPVNATGDAFFQSGSGDILLTNASNNFGTVKFAGKIVSITEAGHLTLVTGSSATGPATFTTAGGDINIVNRGGTVSLASTGLFNASGNITLPKLIQVSDTVTLSAAGTKDLSKLSVSGDLGNKAPQNFGTGTYVPPLP